MSATSGESVPTFTDAANDRRKKVKEIASSILKLKQEVMDAKLPENSDRSEMMANLTLAYRHLEDCSMRFGKAIQAFDGGVSVYDKDTTVGA